MSLSFGISDDLPSDALVHCGVIDRFRSLRRQYPNQAFTSEHWGQLAKIEKKQAQSCISNFCKSKEMIAVKDQKPYRYRFTTWG